MALISGGKLFQSVIVPAWKTALLIVESMATWDHYSQWMIYNYELDGWYRIDNNSIGGSLDHKAYSVCFHGDTSVR